MITFNFGTNDRWKSHVPKKTYRFFLFFFFVSLIFNNFFFRRRSRSMPFFGCSACLTVCYQENKEVTRPLGKGWAPDFRLKTLAENNWMFGSKYCNLELRRRTIFPVPCAVLKLAAFKLFFYHAWCTFKLASSLTEKKWFVTTENLRQRQLRAC